MEFICEQWLLEQLIDNWIPHVGFSIVMTMGKNLALAFVQLINTHYLGIRRMVSGCLMSIILKDHMRLMR